MFGGRAFGSTYFAQAGGVRKPTPPTPGFGHGGSGFRKDWLRRLHDGILEPPPVEDDEVAVLLAAGLLR